MTSPELGPWPHILERVGGTAGKIVNSNAVLGPRNQRLVLQICGGLGDGAVYAILARGPTPGRNTNRDARFVTPRLAAGLPHSSLPMLRQLWT